MSIGSRIRKLLDGLVIFTANLKHPFGDEIGR